MTWFLRVISRLPRAGNNHHPWPSNRSEVVVWRGIDRGRRLAWPACGIRMHPGAGPRLPLTPITASSPLSQITEETCRHPGLSARLGRLQGWTLCAAPARLASGQELHRADEGARSAQGAATALERAVLFRFRKIFVRSS